jgi:lipopolysaccharide export system protein LptA
VLQTATLTGDIQANLDGEASDFEIRCAKIDLVNGANLVATLTGGVKATQTGESGTITLTSDSATADLVALGESSAEPLKKIRLNGDVLVQKPGADDNLELSTQGATYVPGKTGRITFPNALIATQTKPGSKITMNASEGVVEIVQGKNPLQTATLLGAVKLLASRSGTSKSGEKYTDRYEATGQKLVYSDAERRIVLTSRVKVESKSRAMEGTAEGTELIVLLDENRKAKGVEMNGDPGTAEIKETGNKP